MTKLVSTVICAGNALDNLLLSVRSASAQTHGAHGIIVVDHGAGGAAGRLDATTRDAITILRSERAGASAARNIGIKAARGEYIALLDSDDEWLSDKLARQVRFLEEHPDCGLVLTDVVEIDEERREQGVLRRRELIPEDGRVLDHVLRQPLFVPSSALFRTRVVDDVGGFDPTLPAFADLDFHMRVALRFGVGVIAAPLTRVMQRSEVSASGAVSPAEYLHVVERYLLDHRHEIAPEQRRAALREAELRVIRGLFDGGRLGDGLAICARIAARARSRDEAATVARLAPMFLRALGRKARLRR